MTTEKTDGTVAAADVTTSQTGDQGTSEQTPEPGMSKADVAKLLSDQSATLGRDMKVLRDEVAGLLLALPDIRREAST